MIFNFLTATGETLYMVFLSCLISVLFGLPIGIYMYLCGHVRNRQRQYQLLNAIVNVTRSVPFIILMIALIPLTRLLVGSSIGTNAAIIPLSLGAIPFFARLIDNTCQSLPKGLIEAGEAMGANTWQLVHHIVVPECLPAFIQAVTVLAVTLVNYSAMAGAVGGGGLGDLAIRYGYQRFNPSVMVITVLLLIILVQLIQAGGDRIAKHYNHN
jgi:D-methionine transport system permease protein